MVVTALSGCASITNDSTHPMRVDTRTENGATVTGAPCTANNDYGQVAFRSGETVQIRRSSQDLNITCVQPGQPQANGRAISRANSGMWGNIIIGGGIGAIIDHNKGTAYTYPTWMQLVFGRTFIFDRSAEKEGQPVAGTEPAGSPPLSAQQPVAAPPAVAASAPNTTSTSSVSQSSDAKYAPSVEQGAPKIEPVVPARDAYVAERLARELKCNDGERAKLIGKGPAYESYSFQCTNGETLIMRCELGNCRVLK